MSPQSWQSVHGAQREVAAAAVVPAPGKPSSHTPLEMRRDGPPTHVFSQKDWAAAGARRRACRIRRVDGGALGEIVGDMLTAPIDFVTGRLVLAKFCAPSRRTVC